MLLLKKINSPKVVFPSLNLDMENFHRIKVWAASFMRWTYKSISKSTSKSIWGVSKNRGKTTTKMDGLSWKTLLKYIEMDDLGGKPTLFGNIHINPYKSIKQFTLNLPEKSNPVYHQGLRRNNVDLDLATSFFFQVSANKKKLPMEDIWWVNLPSALHVISCSVTFMAPALPVNNGEVVALHVAQGRSRL